MYAAKRGPTLSRPKWDDAPRGTGRSSWDHVEIAALLYGPREEGCCGVERDSVLDCEVRAWATNPGMARTREVRAVEVRMRRRLRAHGLQPTHRHTMVARLRFLGLDPRTGATREHDHLVVAHALNA
jgi:hypothetical protein